MAKALRGVGEWRLARGSALCSQRASHQDKKNYAGTFDLDKQLKLVQLPTLSKKTYGFTCIIANPKPLFAP